MRQFVCNYAPVRFLPYRELGEFVNIGVVVHCPQTDYFGFRLIARDRIGRVKAFFPELDPLICKSSLQGLARELARVQAVHRVLPTGAEIAPEIARKQVESFREVIRRREGLLHFGETGSLVAEDPEMALQDVFDRFVERQFARQQKHQETEMRSRLAPRVRSAPASH